MKELLEEALRRFKDIRVVTGRIDLDSIITRIEAELAKPEREVVERSFPRYDIEASFASLGADFPVVQYWPSKNGEWVKFEDVKNAPFVPDEDKRPDGAMGFFGAWWFNDSPTEPGKLKDGEFFIKAKEPIFRPTQPQTDAELTAMFNALPISEKMAKLGVKL